MNAGWFFCFFRVWGLCDPRFPLSAGSFFFFSRAGFVRLYSGGVLMAERLLDLSRLAIQPGQDAEEVRRPLPVATPFVEMLNEQLKEVNAKQLYSENDMRRLTTGDVNDISDVVLSVTQGELALKMVVEIRNKLVEAYQTLSRMPV
jgi:flagellar hook-basal body complex protein FliE